MAFTGTMMMALVYAGYGLLAMQLCRRRGAAALAFFLLFLNGGLGFFYTLDATVNGYEVTTMWDNLANVMQGYYQTPTNQPDPHNLRWVNIICDMLVPQRGILGGWTLLMPALNLLVPPLCRRERHGVRELVLLGPVCRRAAAGPYAQLSGAGAVFRGCMRLLRGDHAPGGRWEAFRPWLLYGTVAAALSLPQLIAFTLCRPTGSAHFLSVWFNWANNGATGAWWIPTCGSTSKTWACPMC